MPPTTLIIILHCLILPNRFVFVIPLDITKVEKYVEAFGIVQALERQITKMINSVIEQRDSKPGSVTAQVYFANKIQEDSRILMETGVVSTTQRDSAFSIRGDTTINFVDHSSRRSLPAIWQIFQPSYHQFHQLQA